MSQWIGIVKEVQIKFYKIIAYASACKMENKYDQHCIYKMVFFPPR